LGHPALGSINVGLYPSCRDLVVRREESKGDMMTWAGNTLATVGAAVGVGAGAIGLLMAFGYINEGSVKPFSDGMTWLLGGLVVAIVANVFRREHHIVDEHSTTRNNQKADDADKVIGNALGMILRWARHHECRHWPPRQLRVHQGRQRKSL
jgi:hypothetical protein